MNTIINPNPILDGTTCLGTVAQSLAEGEPQYIGAYAELVGAANWAAAALLKELAAEGIENELNKIRTANNADI